MKTLVFDSYPLLAWFRREPSARTVAARVSEAANGFLKIYLSAINAGEVYYVLGKRDSRKEADEWEQKILPALPIEIVVPDLEGILHSAKLKANYPISYADAFAASLAIDLKAPLLTGDPEFRTKAIRGLRLEWLGSK